MRVAVKNATMRIAVKNATMCAAKNECSYYKILDYYTIFLSCYFFPLCVGVVSFLDAVICNSSISKGLSISLAKFIL